MALFRKKKTVVPIDIRTYEDLTPRPSFFARHRTLTVIVAAVLVIALTFIGIRWYLSRSNPVSRFVSASSKTFDASFSYEIDVKYGGNLVMNYVGAMKVDNGSHAIKAAYEATYTGYQYRNVVYTDQGVSYAGNYYNGQWTVTDATDHVLDFFDFYSDYRNNRFDGAAFLRFTGKTSVFSAKELENLVNRIVSKLSTENSLTNLKISKVDGGTEYCYRPDLYELMTMIEKEGGPAFVRAGDYEDFVNKIKLNQDSLASAELEVSYTIDNNGYLTKCSAVFSQGPECYEIYCTMRDFGNAEPNISADFFEAASIKLPE